MVDWFDTQAPEGLALLEDQLAARRRGEVPAAMGGARGPAHPRTLAAGQFLSEAPIVKHMTGLGPYLERIGWGDKPSMMESFGAAGDIAGYGGALAASAGKALPRLFSLSPGQARAPTGLPFAETYPAKHYGPPGLTEVDPSQMGAGIATRADTGNFPGGATWWYPRGRGVQPEAGVGPVRYEADLQGMYPGSDPLNLRQQAEDLVMARERAKRSPELARSITPGKFGPEINQEFQRLLKDRGYAGFTSEQAGRPMAVTFGKQSVREAQQRAELKALGATAAPKLESAGGFTLNPRTGEPVTEGFAVAPNVGGRKLEEKIPGTATPEQIDAYAKANQGLLSEEGNMLGGWVHEGDTYLDVARVFDEPMGAIRAGKANDEIAMFNLGLGKEVPLAGQVAPPAPGTLSAMYPKQRGVIGDDNIRRTPSGLPAYLPEDPKALAGVPDVPQVPIERQLPARGNPETIARLEDPENIERVLGLVQRGRELGGDAWYNTYPLRESAMETLGPQAGRAWHDQLMNRVAATSAREKVYPNIRRASYFQTRPMQRNPVTGEQPPAPYGTLAHKMHAPQLEEIRQLGHFDTSGGQRAKTASFAENLRGNYAPLTADMHYVRGIGLQKASGAPETSAPSATQYPGVEEFGRMIAQREGIAPAQMQADLWMGAADETGVADPRIWMHQFNDLLADSAQYYNITQKEMLEALQQGILPLRNK